QLLQAFVESHPDVGRPADAWTFATDEDGTDAVRAEARAPQDHGLPAVLAEPDELAFRTTTGVRLPDQLRLDPAALTARLVEELIALGVPVVWPMRAVGVRSVGGGFEVAVAPGAGRDDDVEQQI